MTGDDAPPGGDIGQERSAAPLTKRSVSGGSVETATSLSRDSSSRITRQGTPQDGGSNAHGTPGIFYLSHVGIIFFFFFHKCRLDYKWLNYKF